MPVAHIGRGAAAVLVSAAAVGAVPAVPVSAEPVLHRVTYTVTTESPTNADIYYREADPPTWADYSHNPYVFSPRAEAPIGPDAPWVLTVMLADPQRWAMVTATSGRTGGEPRFRCELSVDDVVVATGEGPRGALCALRHF
jgi:hypothetical protein